MPTIRALRRSRGMTPVELALLAGIPVRVLAAIEYGLLPLDADSRARLGPIFDLAPHLLRAGPPPTQPRAARSYTAPQVALLALSITLISAVLLALPIAGAPRTPAGAAPLASNVRRSAPAPITAGLLARSPASVRTSPAPTSTPQATPTPATPTPTPTPTPAFTLGVDGPHGCPLARDAGHVVLTQGYGEGTHAPAQVWGALDLAIDRDGDGAADPDATRGATVVATHGGIAHVFLGSWPGGNYIRVEDAAGWSTAYAHLDTVAVVDGQALADGAPIGTVGSTGFATGPHLHYEVWHGAENIDPSLLIDCR